MISQNLSSKHGLNKKVYNSSKIMKMEEKPSTIYRPNMVLEKEVTPGSVFITTV